MARAADSTPTSRVFISRLIASTVTGCAIALTSIPSFAGLLSFNFVGASGPVLSFTLTASPTPDNNTEVDFELFDVPAIVGGVASTMDIAFFSSDADPAGGFAAFGDGGDFNTVGPQIFSGTPAAPTFTPGVYTLSAFSENYVGGALTISDVPEPTALALLGIGLAGLVVARRRKAQ